MDYEQKREEMKVATLKEILDGYELRTNSIPLTEAALLNMRRNVIAKAERLLQEKGGLTSSELSSLNLFPKKQVERKKNERTLDSLSWQEREDVFDQINRLVEEGSDRRKARKSVFSRRGIVD